MRRRILESEGKMSTFEPFYSDFPEISAEEDGLYSLTPQTDDTTNINSYIEVGDNVFTWAGSKSKDTVITIAIIGETSSIFNGDITTTGAFMRSKAVKRGNVKYKACSGSKESAPVVTYYVEKLL